MLSVDEVREMRRLYAEGLTQTALAERYRVTQATVSRVVSGRLYPSVEGVAPMSSRVTAYRTVYIEGRLDQGCENLSTIARQLGITRQAVQRLVWRKGLRRHTC